MTDRELLEMAAEAAGYDATSHWVGGSDYVLNIDSEPWNPLEDDSDALRLAAECKLTVCMDGDGSVSAHTAYDPSICFVTQFINHRECKHAAIRRAIVRAAAEIGKGMK